MPVCSDANRIEGAETFFVSLAHPTNATLAGAAGLPSDLTSSPTLPVTRGQATIN